VNVIGNEVFSIVVYHGEYGIRCGFCRVVSWHLSDVKAHYCSNCNVYHPVAYQFQKPKPEPDELKASSP